MRRDRLQNHVAGSVFTLPVCAVVAVLLWWFPLGQYRLDYAVGLGLATLIGYVLLETNNRFHLIRVRSRMVASVWAVFAAITASLHVWHEGMVVALCLAVAHLSLFYSYEQRQPVKESFHAGLFLGVGSLFVPWLAVMPLLFMLHQVVYLRSFSLRCFFATLIGSLFPAMVVLVPSILRSDYSRLTDWYAVLTSFKPISLDAYLALTLQQAVTWLLPSLLVLLGGIHYLCTSFNDKISVRMMLYICLTDAVVVLAFTALQPQHGDLLLASLLVSGSPLVAHFFALTHGWFTNFLFILSLLCCAAVGYVTLVMPTIPLSEIITIQ